MATPTFPLGICGGMDCAAVASGAGADYLEVNVQTFLLPGEDDAAGFESNLAGAANLRPSVRNANLFLPGSLPCVGPAVDGPALVAYAARAFARAGRAGIRHIVFGSGGARMVPDKFPRERAHEQFVELLKNIAPLAERAGITLVVEPLNPHECNFINTLAEGAEVVRACDHPHVMLLGDTYHMGFTDEGPEVARRFGGILRHFHVAEYPSRRYPGADGGNYTGWFEALRGVGYTGGISVECKWENIATEAGPAFANLRRDLAAVGEAEPAPSV